MIISASEKIAHLVRVLCGKTSRNSVPSAVQFGRFSHFRTLVAIMEMVKTATASLQRERSALVEEIPLPFFNARRRWWH